MSRVARNTLTAEEAVALQRWFVVLMLCDDL